MAQLHSRYNPEKEAQRFVESLRFPCEPSIIIITEPASSWLASPLRAKYPNAFLGIVRYQDSLFYEEDSLWDSVWRPGHAQSLHSFLLSCISDDLIQLSAFIPWKPSDDNWPEIAQCVWKTISDFIRMQMSVMHTRAHFGHKWFSNILKNLVLTEHPVCETWISKPVFLAAAGPSLESNLTAPDNLFTFFTVSSAVECLMANGIVPKLCFSTDGGYWAEQYLNSLPQEVTLALPLEAAAPSHILHTNSVLFLDYGGALEKELFSLCGLTGTRSERNGTVSGTAALYALSHSNGPVYCAGLDLYNGTGFSHARPHIHERNLASIETRFIPQSNMLYERNGSTISLDMYASWFASRNESFRNRFIRLSPVLRQIEGLQVMTLEKAVELESQRRTQNNNVFTEKSVNTGLIPSERKLKILNYLESIHSISTNTVELQQSLERTIKRISPDSITEVFQLSAFGAYSAALKKIANEDKGLDDALLFLSRAVTQQVETLINKVKRYGV